MKTALYILIFLAFELGFGQQTDKDSEENLTVTSTNWITENCSDLENVYENNECVRNEINKFINRKFNFPEDIKKGNYTIPVNIAVDQKGIIKKINARGENAKLNSELERVISLFPNKLKLIDQNGVVYEHSGIFRFYINVE
ncbi:MAG: hypothetical protein CMC05_09920 [Flavobacteriaceae bacterium]|jgi:hypothetical protein|nr:hypothetical protein [Flavobacteriaceae bacterium]|tara:strand:- start:114 stop:539 length:426 start_codon:yes stop_codon:yes gene_type:complete